MPVSESSSISGKNSFSPILKSLDLRNFVRCRHLRPLFNSVSASQTALEKCKTSGLSFEDLQNDNNTDYKINNGDKNSKVDDLYVDCDSVFNDNLGAFTTSLITDYRWCKEVGRIDNRSRLHIERKFANIFKMLTGKCNLFFLRNNCHFNCLYAISRRQTSIGWFGKSRKLFRLRKESSCRRVQNLRHDVRTWIQRLGKNWQSRRWKFVAKRGRFARFIFALWCDFWRAHG